MLGCLVLSVYLLGPHVKIELALVQYKAENFRSPDFKTPIGPTKNLERLYNQVVVWLLFGYNAGYNRLIPV